MLVVIDMQNHILDPDSESYIPGCEALIPNIKKRITKARTNNEIILYTRDIPVEMKDTPKEEAEELQIISDIAPQADEIVVKKYYFTIPPDKLLEICKSVKDDFKQSEKLEVIGVETSLCVLSNALALQSAFPEADIFIDPNLVCGRKHNDCALALFKQFNIEVLN